MQVTKSLKPYLTIIILAVSLLCSCSKRDINGDLDGQWQLVETDTAGETSVPSEPRYWSFQLHVCQLTYYGGVFTTGNLDYDGARIRLDFPYATSEDSQNKLRSWGIYENPVDFKIESLGAETLLLSASGVRLKLRKL